VSSRNSSDASRRQVQAFRALSNPARYEILRSVVCSGEWEPCREIIARLGVTPPAVSGHLRVLEAADLVQLERRGAQLFVALAPTDLAYQMAAVIRLAVGASPSSS